MNKFANVTGFNLTYRDGLIGAWHFKVHLAVIKSKWMDLTK